MITFLSSPKAFSGVSFKNQINAIQSWLHIDPSVEVILYGDSPGCKEVSKNLGIKHIANISCSPSGVPYFNAIADHAQKHALYDIQVYLNCDILLTEAILNAISIVSFPKYLLVGQRIDLAETVDVNFRKDGWPIYVESLIRQGDSVLHAPSGIDYFIFTRGLWEGIKPLVIGRAGYDSALVAFCLRQGIPVIDGTYVIPAIHQHHAYNHIDGRLKEVTSGIDAINNKRLHGVEHSAPNIADANWLIYNGKIFHNNTRGDYLRHFESFLRYKKNMIYLSYVVRAIWRLLSGLKIYKPNKIELSEVVEHIIK